MTDGATHPDPRGCLVFWRVIDEAVIGLGFTSIWTKLRLPVALLWLIALVCELIGALCGVRMKLNRFGVRLLTMHRWFRIDAAVRDLGYEPIIGFKEGWADTIVWFREHWLPVFQASRKSGFAGLSAGTQFKIDVQASGTGAAAAAAAAGAGAGADVAVPAAGGDAATAIDAADAAGAAPTTPTTRSRATAAARRTGAAAAAE